MDYGFYPTQGLFKHLAFQTYRAKWLLKYIMNNLFEKNLVIKNVNPPDGLLFNDGITQFDSINMCKYSNFAS
jgi:hypothetical protein